MVESKVARCVGVLALDSKLRPFSCLILSKLNFISANYFISLGLNLPVYKRRLLIPTPPSWIKYTLKYLGQCLTLVALSEYFIMI